MKTRIILTIILVIVLVSASSYHSSQAGSGVVQISNDFIERSTGTGSDPFSKPADYDSGWTDIVTNQEILFNHNLGGNPNNYVIDLQAFNNVQGSHQYLYGIDSSYRTDHLEFHGFYWYAITTGSIKVKRAYADVAVSQVRIRIWVVPSADFDTGWISLSKGEERTIDHYLGGDPDEYVVDFQLMHNGGLGVNNISYGMDAYYDNGISNKELGAAWSALDNKSINVKRTSDDYTADNLRVRIWRVSDQDYDSGWQTINQASSKTFYHNLGGPWNDYKVDVQFMHDGQFGIHQISYGGDVTFENNIRSDVGAFISHLNNNYVTVRRETDDKIVNKIRVRIWVNPAPKYDSGWLSIQPDEFKTIEHKLGGDPDHYVLDLQFRYQGGRIHQMGYGGDNSKYIPNGKMEYSGVYWWGLNEDQVKIHRLPNDLNADEVRARIWIAPVPSYDSDWVSVNPDGIAQDFIHSLGGNPDDYVIDMQFRDSSATGIGVNQQGFGWNYFKQSATNDVWQGAAWSNLNDDSLSVVRGYQDTGAEQVRIRIWMNKQPDYDSNWSDLNIAEEVFTHQLGGNPNDYVVDMQFQDEGFHGVNQIYYGENTSYEVDGYLYESGGQWRDLNNSSVRVNQGLNDVFVEKVRVRIWKAESLPSNYIYLPSVTRTK